MKNKLTLSWFVKGFAFTFLVLAVVLITALSSNGLAQSGGAPEPPSAPQAVSQVNSASPLVIPAAAFTNDGSDPDGFFFNFSGYTNGDGTACLKAPAYLPHGATVTDLYGSLYDNNTGDVFSTLRRVDITDGSSDILAEVSTVSDSTSIQQRHDDTINYALVSYPQYAYYVTVCLNWADHRIYAARIYFTGP